MIGDDAGEAWDLPGSLEGGADPLPGWVGDDPGPRRPVREHCAHCGWHASRCAALPGRSQCCALCGHEAGHG